MGGLMGDEWDFSADYLEEYGAGDYGGGGGYYSDYLNFDDLYGGGYGPGVDEIPVDLPTFGNDVWYVEPDYSPTDPYTEYQSYWESIGFDWLTPPAETISTYEQGSLPTVGQNWWDFAYQGFLPPLESPPYIPDVGPIPEPPAPPITQTPNLPPACPGGQYHPYPIGHPQQNICVPFPATQTPTPSKPQPQTGSSGGSSGGSKSGSQPQQQCSTGYCKHPVTGQCIPIPAGYQRDSQTQKCMPITQQQQKCSTGYYRAPNGQCLPIPRCTTPGTVFDAARGLCVPKGQAVSPLPEPGTFDDLFSSLKEIPWWLWLALGGLLLLGQGGEERKKVTVQHRRAS